MRNTLFKIKTLYSSLPEKDHSAAEHFITYRQFEDLGDLVDSAIYKIKKDRESENPKEEYKEISLKQLYLLQKYVDMYYKDIEGEDRDHTAYEE